MSDTVASSATAFEQLQLQRAELPDRRNFHFVEAGSGSPLVFVHGVLGDWRAWAPQWSDFNTRFRCIAYSRRMSVPNLGNQFGPDHSAKVEAEDLLDLLAVWQAKPAIIVGSSYGAFTALAAALREPASIRALVLVEPPMLRWADFTEEGRLIKARFDKEIREPALLALKRGDDAYAVALLTEGIVGASKLASMPPQVLARRLENVAAFRAQALSTDEFPFLDPEAVQALRIPTLLLAGEQTPPIHDVVFRTLVKTMTQAEHARIPSAGHSASRDNPKDFNQKVLAFLDRNVK